MKTTLSRTTKKLFGVAFSQRSLFAREKRHTHVRERERVNARVCVAKKNSKKTREMLPEIVVKEDAKIVIDDVTNDDDDDDIDDFDGFFSSRQKSRVF